jgi:hypothetical protein
MYLISVSRKSTDDNFVCMQPDNIFCNDLFMLTGFIVILIFCIVIMLHFMILQSIHNYLMRKKYSKGLPLKKEVLNLFVSVKRMQLYNINLFSCLSTLWP